MMQIPAFSISFFKLQSHITLIPLSIGLAEVSDPSTVASFSLPKVSRTEKKLRLAVQTNVLHH